MTAQRTAIFQFVTTAAAVAALALSSVGAAAEGDAQARLTSKDPCADGEKWSFPEDFGESWRDELSGFLAGRKSPVRGFSQGLALRRQAGQSVERKVLGEYWVARALYESKLQHVAFNAFSLIAAYPVRERTAGVQIAALACLAHLQARYGSMHAPEALGARLPEYLNHLRTDEEKEAFWSFASSHARQLIGMNRPKAQVEKALDLLKGAGPYEAIARGMWAARVGNHEAAVAELAKFAAAPSLPKLLRRFSDPAHILAARSLYSVGKFKEAAEELKRVKKSSNELARALSELAWAYLMNDQYGEAIGTAMNFQAGGLRNTFAPEAPMVMAMALNELCQFPESLKAVNSFRKAYEKPYRWLDGWASSPKPEPLYPLAVKFLKKQGDVPSRVASEWVRSPLFLSHQEEINLLFDEREGSAAVGRAGAREQRKLALDVINRWKDLKAKIKKLRAAQQKREPLPASMMVALKNLRADVTAFRRFVAAAPAFRQAVDSHEAKAPRIKAQLVARINEDLADRSRQMHVMLAEVAENNQLIEVEIYNGASQDIIWQNAHPDYKEAAREMKDQQQKAAAEKVWDWGRAPSAASIGAEDVGVEIWEDELGSFKADLYDNCSSKDKYLAIKRRSS